MSNRIPPLLESYLGLPEEASLIVLTNVLGARSNWLVLRYVYSILVQGRENVEGRENVGEEEAGVVLVSFMRDFAFWREGASRLGLDLDTLIKSQKLSFVDGLTGLFAFDDINFSSGAGGGSINSSNNSSSSSKGTVVLKSEKLEDVKRGIEAAISHLGTRKKVLIVDQADELLAVSGEEGVSSLGVENMLLWLRERTHATILTFAADDPLLHAQNTTLERSHAALVLSQAHAADEVVSLRLLDTGVAKDVSGVMRIATGREGGGGIEYLYYVAGDGGVRVFERGA